MVNEKPFKLDMPFKEALRRFVQTDENEIPERKKLRRRMKAGGLEPPAPPEPRNRDRQRED
jgi:hypothetical protein